MTLGRHPSRPPGRSAGPPVHLAIREALLERLRQVPLETRLPSDRELAREFNVAFLTINRVMGDLEREGWVERRPRRGTFLASRQRPVQADDDVRPGANGSVAIAYPNWFSHHLWRHVRLAEELALKNGLALHEYKLNPGSTPERVLAWAQRAEGLRGLLMLPVPASLTPASLAQLDGLGVPVVLLCAVADVASCRNLHAYDTDWVAAGRLAAGALLDAGHRRIAWINHEPGRDDRLARGMRETLRERGLRGSDLVTLSGGTEAWGDAREAGYRLAQRLLDGGQATAAVVDSVGGAMGALRALGERGLQAPRDLSLIASGMQDGTEDHLWPPLASLDSDWEAEMRRAFAVVLGQDAAAERQWDIPVRLVPRASIAPPNG